MSQEAEIIINGTRLNYAESETMRVAIDTLANVLAEAIEAKDEGVTAAATERYLAALIYSAIRGLGPGRPSGSRRRLAWIGRGYDATAISTLARSAVLLDEFRAGGATLYRKTALMFLCLSSFCMECTTSGFRKSIITNSSRSSP
jgi:hypothetical protein